MFPTGEFIKLNFLLGQFYTDFFLFILFGIVNIYVDFDVCVLYFQDNLQAVLKNVFLVFIKCTAMHLVSNNLYQKENLNLKKNFFRLCSQQVLLILV